MIFTEKKIKELKEHKTLQVLKYDEELLIGLFKTINDKFKGLKDFISNIEDMRFVMVFNKAQVKNGSKVYSLKESSSETDADLLVKDESEYLSRIKNKRKIENVQRSNSAKKSDFELDCDDFVNIFYLNKIFTLDFSDSFGNQIYDVFTPSRPENQKNFSDPEQRVQTVDFLRLTKLFEFLLRREVCDQIEKYSDSIEKTCKEINNIRKLKQVMVKSIETEKRKEVNEIFLNYDFVYSKKNKKESIKEIQDLLTLQLDLVRKVNVRHIEKNVKI